MSLSFQCPKCKKLNSLKRVECWHCCASLPKLGRGCTYFTEWRRNGKKHRKSIGRVVLENAKRVDVQVRLAVKLKQRTIIEIGAPQSRMSWRGASDQYIAICGINGVGEARIGFIRSVTNKMLEHWGRDPDVNTITSDMFESYMLEQGDRLQAITVNNHIRAARAIWKRVVKLTPSPLDSIKLFRERERQVRVLTEEQERLLLDAARKISVDLYQTIIVALGTGLRKSNIINLKWDEVDLPNGFLRVTQKGAKRHVVPISQPIVSMLEQIPRNQTPYVWISCYTHDRPYTKSWSRTWHSAKKKAGIAKEFRFHDLRHTVGTRIVERYGNIRYAQEILGHANQKTTQRYAHIVSEKLREISDSLSPL